MTRAAALPVEERRAAVLAALVPLLEEHGPDLTTRQIAAAAGVAEGTLFRVFPDKESMIAAAVAQVLDPTATQCALHALAQDERPLEQVLHDVVALLQRDVTRALRVLAHAPPVRDKLAMSELPALVELLRRHAGRLGASPAEAAAQLSAVTLALTLPWAYPRAPAPPEVVVGLVLYGLLGDPAAPQGTSSAPPARPER